MLRISKLTDYAVILLVQLAREPHSKRSASELARACRLPEATVSKILKALVRAGLVVSLRGSQGGCRLARAPSSISLANALEAMEGALMLTDCGAGCAVAGHCERQPTCLVSKHWQGIGDLFRSTLERTTLADVVRAAGSVKPET